MKLIPGPCDKVITDCEFCKPQAEPPAPPQPITFLDDEGREWALRAEQSEHAPGGCLIRDVTPDDLARAGYEPPLTVRGHIVLLRSLGSEVRALRALEKHVRTQPVSGYWHATLADLLKAIDEAREK